MFLKLITRRRGTQEIPRPDLRWIELDASDTVSRPGLIPDLIEKKVDGILVHGIFTQAEIDHSLATFAEHREESTPQSFGAMLGMPLNQLGNDSDDRGPYLDDHERCSPIYRKGFGFDPLERLVEVLSPMADGYVIEPPVEDGRPYNPANVRWYDPGAGGLKAHAGNEFIDLVGNGAMKHLRSTTEVFDHMSWFVVLQRPDAGGQLSVFDLLWRDHPEHFTAWDESQRDDSFFDTVSALRLDPAPGDLILFGGGWRWHRVDKVEGTRPRITWGGFASPARSTRSVHVWC